MHKLLVSKETVVLRCVKSETQKLGSAKRTDEGPIITVKDLES